MAGLVLEAKRMWDRCFIPKEDIQQLSLDMFHDLLPYAWDNCKFYRELWASVGIKRDDLERIDPEDLPCIDKEDVRNNFLDIACVPIRYRQEEFTDTVEPVVKNSCYTIHSSGSTGKPCPFIYSRHAITLAEANFARLSALGPNPVGWSVFPIKSLHVASVGSGYASALILDKGLNKYLAKSKVLKADMPLDEWRSELGGFKPNYISGYPSCVSLLANLQETNQIDLHPRKLILGGEYMSQEDMKYLSDIFGCDVIDYYGCSESLFIGAGFSFDEGMYLFDDMNYVEQDSKHRLIITPLNNDVFPLIRYKTGDIVQGFTKEDDFSLPFTHIDKVVGRQEDMLWFYNNTNSLDFLHPLMLDDLHVNGLANYQFIQLDTTSLEVDCVLEPNTNKDKVLHQVDKQLRYMLKSKDMDNVRLVIKVVPNITRDAKTGKCPMVIKN